MQNKILSEEFLQFFIFSVYHLNKPYTKEISWKLKRQKETLERISQGIQLLELPEREFILFC